MMDKAPAHNLEFEQMVLGAVLFKPELFPQVDLRPEEFYRSDHELIFRAMIAVYADGRLPDAIAVHQYIREHHAGEGITAHFLAQLEDNVGTSANIHWYVNRLRELADKRKALELWEHIGQRLRNGGNPGPLLAELADLVTPVDRSFPPLSRELSPLSECLKAPIQDREHLLEDILPAKIVGGVLARGGTGKGFFNIMFGLSLATGRSIGPLQSADKFHVLYLAAEDGQEELLRRAQDAINAFWPEGAPPDIDNFIPASVAGKGLGPLMHLDNAGNPVTAPAYDWLCKTLSNLESVDVLMLDPKSKFYGLVENDNTQNALWINCLESLVDRFGITILFSHHESKIRAGTMDQASSRGGSALTDGCRWVANLAVMDLKTAEKYEIADPHNYVVLDVTKSNYAAKLPAPIYFRRGAGGALTYVDLRHERISGIADRLFNLLTQEEAAGRYFSRNDLLYRTSAKPVMDALKESIAGFSRLRDVGMALDHLLEGGWLTEVLLKGKSGPGKTVFRTIENA
jgi:hypothetical protein